MAKINAAKRKVEKSGSFSTSTTGSQYNMLCVVLGFIFCSGIEAHKKNVCIWLAMIGLTQLWLKRWPRFIDSSFSDSREIWLWVVTFNEFKRLNYLANIGEFLPCHIVWTNRLLLFLGMCLWFKIGENCFHILIVF